MGYSPLVVFLVLAGWSAVHSLLTSHHATALALRRCGQSARRGYRLAYNLFAGFSLLPVLIALRRLPDRPLYAIPAPWLVLTMVVQVVAVVIAAAAVIQTGALSFLGLRQLAAPGGRDQLMPAWRKAARASGWLSAAADFPAQSHKLVTHGVYAWMRHPIYTAGLVFIWLAPVMTVNLVAFNLAVSLYFVAGSTLEEGRLLAGWGEAYADYRRQVPKFIPRLPKR